MAYFRFFLFSFFELILSSSMKNRKEIRIYLKCNSIFNRSESLMESSKVLNRKEKKKKVFINSIKVYRRTLNDIYLSIYLSFARSLRQSWVTVAISICATANLQPIPAINVATIKRKNDCTSEHATLVPRLFFLIIVSTERFSQNWLHIFAKGKEILCKSSVKESY